MGKIRIKCLIIVAIIITLSAPCLAKNLSSDKTARTQPLVANSDYKNLFLSKNPLIAEAIKIPEVEKEEKKETPIVDNLETKEKKSFEKPVSNNIPEKIEPIIPIIATQQPLGLIYKESSHKINFIDPSAATSPNTYYPGLRGTNELIVYTPQYGLKTGTNEYGTEAIVSGNIVIDVNGADSLIPKDGFIISGHGKSKKWINENISIGTKISIDTKHNIIRTYLVPDSFIFAAKAKIREANSTMQYYRSIDILYEDKIPSQYIMKAKELLRKAEKDPDNAQVYVSQAVENANLAIKNAIPYKANEMKGVWIRPTEKTKYQIAKTVERLSKIGINNIFLETYFHGKTIYPSDVLKKYNIQNQNKDFAGIDPLKIWIEECHKRNIKLNVWFETFYIGNKSINSNIRSVLSTYPEWANTTRIGYASPTPVASLSEHNGYFLDPANPQVQKYLLEIIYEITTNYHPDGINLDYIRYPQSILPKFPNYVMSNWGYTKIAREEFKNEYGADPIELNYGTGLWNSWARYRQNKVTDFVAKVRKMTSPCNITLTTVIFPDRYKSLNTKMQDWKTWSLNNYVDGFTPLILTSDKTTAASMIRDIKYNSSARTKVYPGLFVTFMGGSFNDLLMQIQKAREENTNGVVLFDYAHLKEEYIEALKVRVYNCRSNKTRRYKKYNRRYYTKRKWFRR